MTALFVFDRFLLQLSARRPDTLRYFVDSLVSCKQLSEHYFARGHPTSCHSHLNILTTKYTIFLLYIIRENRRLLHKIALMMDIELYLHEMNVSS